MGALIHVYLLFYSCPTALISNVTLISYGVGLRSLSDTKTKLIAIHSWSHIT